MRDIVVQIIGSADATSAGHSHSGKLKPEIPSPSSSGFMMNRRYQRLLSVSVAMAGCFVSIARADSPPKKVTTVEGITEYRLDNGLRLLVFPDASRPTVTVALTVLVGSRHEGYGETGMAHLLEHMVFKGTPTHAHIPKELQEHGATFNASTSTDRTNYFET